MIERTDIEDDPKGDDGGVNEIEEKQLTPQMMRTLLHILVTTVRGITIPQKTFDEYDEKAMINISFDETNQVWRIWVPRPKAKSVLAPQKKLILPNAGDRRARFGN